MPGFPKLDFVREASKILDEIGFDNNAKLPVKVYELAKNYKLGVLTHANEDGDADFENMSSHVKAVLTTPDGLGPDSAGKDIPNEWKKYYFLLFIYAKRPLEKRLIVAYYIALIHIMLMMDKDDEVAIEAIRKSCFLTSIETVNNPIYDLAIHILVPQSSLENYYREQGLTAEDAKKNDNVIEDLSKIFLLPKFDVGNRLRGMF